MKPVTKAEFKKAIRDNQRSLDRFVEDYISESQHYKETSKNAGIINRYLRQTNFYDSIKSLGDAGQLFMNFDSDVEVSRCLKGAVELKYRD